MFSRIAWTVVPVARRSVLSSRGCILRSCSIGGADRRLIVASFSAAAAQPKSILMENSQPQNQQQQQQLSEPDQDIIKDAVQRIFLANHHSSSSPEKKLLKRMTDEELKKRMDAFHDLWVEARLCMDDCVDSVETEHFEEEAASAKHAVEDAMAAYKDLVYDLAREETSGTEETNHDTLAQKRSQDVRRTNGLKIEQLKAELASLLSTTVAGR